MAEAQEGRALGPVLGSAASTFALFVVTGMQPVQSPFEWEWAAMKLLVLECLQNMANLASLPVSPFIQKVMEVMYVWQLQRKLQLNRDYIIVMTFCPVFIELQPPDLERSELEGEKVAPEHVESLDPLVLCSEEKYGAMAADRLYLKLTGVTSKMRGVSTHYVLKYCLRLRHAPRSHGRKEREALLLALTPERPAVPPEVLKKLKLARDQRRSVFPNLVRMLQALGYMWGVLERVVQKEAVSPVEAVLTYLSVLVALQLLMELYACTQFNRVLVLRLSRQQYAAFFETRTEWARHRQQARKELAPVHATSLPLTSFRFRRARVCAALVLGLISAPYVYHAFANRHKWRCHLCLLSIFLFLLAPIASILHHFEKKLFNLLLGYVIPLNALSQSPQHTSSPYGVRHLVLIFLSYFARIMSVTSMLLVLIATINNWNEFNTKTNTLSSWTWPHIYIST